MQTRKKVGRTKQLASLRLSPDELFSACAARANKFDDPQPLRAAMKALREHQLFLHPLFERQPFASYAKGRYPYNHTLSPPKGRTVPDPEWRYRELVRQLRRQKNRDLRWLLVARWLKLEKVCEPRELLPKVMLDRLIRGFHQRTRLSPTDLSYEGWIKAWLPYFDRVREELHLRRKLERCREEVIKLGYCRLAVELVLRKRSNIQAICHWLADRKHIDPRKLRNAYSRVHPKFN